MRALKHAIADWNEAINDPTAEESAFIDLGNDLSDAAFQYLREQEGWDTSTDLDDHNIDAAEFDSLLSGFDEPEQLNKNYTSILKLSPMGLKVTIACTDDKTVMLTYPTLMHAFQAHKEKYNLEPSESLGVRMTKYTICDLSNANAMGRMVKLDIDKWDTDKYGIMKDIVSECVSQNDEVWSRLASAPHEIVEDLLPDKYWGMPGNNLGKIWASIRDELKSKEDKAQG